METLFEVTSLAAKNKVTGIKINKNLAPSNIPNNHTNGSKMGKK